MGQKSLMAIALVAILTLGYLVYLAATYEPPEGTTTVVIPPPTPEEVTTDPAPPPPAQEPVPEPVETIAPPAVAQDPVIASPPEEVLPEPEEEITVVELPRLNESDGFILDNLREMTSGMALVRQLADDQLVRRFVVYVDNISKRNFPEAQLPYNAIQQEMPVRTVDENLYVMDEAAFDRFDAVIDAFVALDTGQAVAFYRTLAPLFQQAYAEIGFRDVNFDDTLEQAIRNVLSTERMEGPYQLIKPSVMYLYADTDLENLPGIDKQLMRIGPENTEKLKAKLRGFLMQL
ncbi:MAG: DUF3014 domain-containing protein [Pseudohongiellaceae bacterium]